MYLEPGTKIAIDQFDYTVVDGENPEDVELRSNESEKIYHVNLLNKLESGSLVSSLGSSRSVPSASGPNLLAIDAQRYEQARNRYTAILPLLKLENRTTEDIAEAAVKAGVNRRSIYYWLERYGNGGIKGLVTPESFGGKGKPKKKNRKAESILRQILEDKSAPDQPVPLTTAKNLYKIEYAPACASSEVNPLSERQFRREFALAREHSVVRDTEGPRGPYVRKGFGDMDFPLQTVQIDHTKLDVILVDEVTRKVIGRPWLTIALDVYSRCVWGYYLGLQQPNADAVGLTILNGCFKKDDIVSRFGLPEWPVYGVPFQIHTDNGKDFRSTSVERGCVSNRINVMRRPVETPEYGPYIERFFNTLETQFVHTLPGTTLSNPKDRGDYDSEKHACLTLDNLEQQLLHYIVGQYHRSTHRVLGMTPLEKWKQGLEGKETGHPILPQEPKDKERFRQDFLPFVDGGTKGPDGIRREGTRLIESDGVHFKRLVYWADELRALKARGKLGEAYYVRYDPSDLRFVHLLDGTNDAYYKLILNSRPPEPFSLRDLEIARREQKAKGQAESDESMVIETIRRRQQAIRDSIDGSKTARKAFAAHKREEETRNGLHLPSPSKQAPAYQSRVGSPGGPDADIDSASLDSEVDIDLDGNSDS